jgi:site-specific DNA-methyltransferase (adenine-specific)
VSINNGLFSSATGEWSTPQALFDQLEREFHFDLDVCATAENAKCSRYYTKEQDGLAQPWAPFTCWMNPPYGSEIGKWVQKAYEETIRGKWLTAVVCLLPARTDTRWFHEYCMRAYEIRLIRGRLHFGGAKNSAPFPSAIVVFNGAHTLPLVTSMTQEKGRHERQTE